MKVNKLIESVQVYTQYDVTCSSGLTEWVGKSDFDRVVEELTKWNKVEDGLPKNDVLILIKHLNGDIHTSRYDGYGFIDVEYSDSGYWCNVTEWKYI